MKAAAALFLLAAMVATPIKSSAQNFGQFIAIDGTLIALTHAKVIDGTGAPAALDQTILIEGDRITAVGPSGSVERVAHYRCRTLAISLREKGHRLGDTFGRPLHAGPIRIVAESADHLGDQVFERNTRETRLRCCRGHRCSAPFWT